MIAIDCFTFGTLAPLAMCLDVCEKLGDGAAATDVPGLRFGVERAQQLAAEREVWIVDRALQPLVVERKALDDVLAQALRCRMRNCVPRWDFTR